MTKQPELTSPTGSESHKRRRGKESKVYGTLDTRVRGEDINEKRPTARDFWPLGERLRERASSPESPSPCTNEILSDASFRRFEDTGRGNTSRRCTTLPVDLPEKGKVASLTLIMRTCCFPLEEAT